LILHKSLIQIEGKDSDSSQKTLQK